MSISPQTRHIVRATYTDSIILLSDKSARYRMPVGLVDASYGDITVGELKLLHVLFYEHVMYRESIGDQMKGLLTDKALPAITVEIEKRILMRALGLESNRLKSYLKRLEKGYVEPNITGIRQNSTRSALKLVDRWSETKGILTIDLGERLSKLLMSFPKMHARVDMRAILSLDTITALSLYPIAAYTAAVTWLHPMRLNQLQVWSNSAYPEHVLPNHKAPEVLWPRLVKLDDGRILPETSEEYDVFSSGYEYVTERPVKNKDRWKFYSVTLPAAVAELTSNEYANLVVTDTEVVVNMKTSNLFFAASKKRERIHFSPNIIVAANIPPGPFRIAPREFAELMVAHDADFALNYGHDAITIKSRYLKDFVTKYAEKCQKGFTSAAELIADMLKKPEVRYNPDLVPEPNYEPVKGRFRTARLPNWREGMFAQEIEYVREVCKAHQGYSLAAVMSEDWHRETHLTSEARELRMKAIRHVEKTDPELFQQAWAIEEKPAVEPEEVEEDITQALLANYQNASEPEIDHLVWQKLMQQAPTMH